ncbi:MAG: 3-dehydroquinate synthase [Phycisphaerales bacterium]|nr:3-dehydroquinate synthase [Phycisphaerales bacterium]
MKTVPVNLADRSYPIVIGDHARTKLRECNSVLAAPQLVVIADDRVAKLHLPALVTALPAEPLILTFPAGEASKSLAVAGRLYDQLAEARVERRAVMVAFGGGVAGDLAGFVAATWLRGVPFVQVPTTLLAAVDAAVGGKTGLDLPAGKNLVGAFHQPTGVYVDLAFLETLPERDYRAGLAESVKHGAIRSVELLEWHSTHAEAITARDGGRLEELIARNCEIKAEVVARDERESGLRAILNHGHTIGHALEHLLDYELRHGECVALGMRVENELAVQRGLLSGAAAQQIAELLQALGLPLRLQKPLEPTAVWEACQVDKKVHAGAVNFVLLRGLGQTQKVADITPEEVVRALRCIMP